MDIPVNVCVICVDGPFGYLDGITLNPDTNEITHLVVEEDKLFRKKYLVPVEKITKSNFRYISLNCSLQELSEFDLFADVEFIPVKDPYDYAYDLPDLDDRTLFSWPYATTKPGYLPTEHEHTPSDELVIRNSTEVFANDGKVGFLDEFMIEPDNHKITELAVRIDYFWGYKDIVVPSAQIEKFSEKSVYLKLSKSAVEALPVISDHEE